MQEVIISSAGWCYLQGLPSLRGLSVERPGVAGKYSRETEEGYPYILIAEGREGSGYKIPLGMEASPVYPERVFAWGVDIPREDTLEILTQLGRKRTWNPVVTWRGYKGGVPTFYDALMSDTHYGYSWYDFNPRSLGDLPQGWDIYRPTNCNYLHLYVE